MNKLQLSEYSNRVFDKYDLDKSGFIDRNELGLLLIALSKEMKSKEPTQQELSYMVSYLDTNKDQRISRDEFFKMSELMVKALSKG